MRVLAVDPGEKRLGIALSDPSATIANPLTVVKHTARLIDAATIANLAHENNAGSIIIGATFDEEGELTPQGRRASRLAEAIRTQTELPVILWDESGSTQAARSARIHMGVTRAKRSGHLDELAATVILQSYLDSIQNL
jgi:putative Holliday junction resolvase